ncbi:uncharacterized protein TM35_000111530 [Trypanosoma theileri]|uniref:RRM domain-containing protein n=1 Tax=Trypanosoma theileri TaxID=67003 RepID=A0A1X0NZI8_9TRYP|nr:uncharacterized protein TM35_000111530 [Trypanosoma theileri]ORC89619.1 hypothetical protein TM35_000111530 [Trypanosoma theileri]
MDEKPRLVEPSPASRRAANVMIVFGFPWYTSESQIREYLLQIYPAAAPVTTRLYTNPTNGTSRGICFIEYNQKQRVGNSSNTNDNNNTNSNNYNSTIGNTGSNTNITTSGGLLRVVKSEIPEEDEDDILTVVRKNIDGTHFTRHYLTAVLYHLTNQSWDRGGRLPELPTDPPPTRGGVGGVVEGYGDEGFIVRCGPVLGLANTVTAAGVANMQALRKRLREEAVAAEEEEEEVGTVKEDGDGGVGVGGGMRTRV